MTTITAVVCVKHVPIGGAPLRLDADRLTREGVSHGIDPLDEVGLEWALQQRENGALDRVVALSMGPPEAAETLRRALAIGADEALLVTDEALTGADVRRTARALATSVERLGAELVVLGYESPDGSSGAVPAAVAALLQRPLLSRVLRADLRGDGLEAERDLGAGPERVAATLPAVVSFVEGAVAPRYPRLRDVVRTKRAEIPTTDAAALGLLDLQLAVEVVTGLRAMRMPTKEPVVVDQLAGPDAILKLLADAGVVL